MTYNPNYTLAAISRLNDWLAWVQRPFTDRPWLKLQRYGYGKDHKFGWAEHYQSRKWQGWTHWWWYGFVRGAVGFCLADKLAWWWALNYQRSFHMRTSDHEQLYYIHEFASGKSAWMAKATHTDFPPPEDDPERDVHKHLGFVMGYEVGTPQQYWRACLPFPYWKVRTRQDLESIVKRNDPLVQDYMYLALKERADAR